VHDVLAPDVAHTMTAMLEEVVQFGTAIKAKSIGRPAGGKTGTTQDFTDAWFIGFTPQITAGVWVGFDDKQISLGKRETGAQAALPIWIAFVEHGMEGKPAADFVNVESLEEQAAEHHVHTDVPDTAPEDEAPAIAKPVTTAPATPPTPTANPPTP
jgi:penicillin-binding protein 1A